MSCGSLDFEFTTNQNLLVLKMTESQQDKKASKLPFRKQFKQINWYILHVHKQKSDDGLGGGDVVVVRLKPH